MKLSFGKMLAIYLSLWRCDRVTIVPFLDGFGGKKEKEIVEWWIIAGNKKKQPYRSADHLTGDSFSHWWHHFPAQIRRSDIRSHWKWCKTVTENCDQHPHPSPDLSAFMSYTPAQTRTYSVRCNGLQNRVTSSPRQQQPSAYLSPSLPAPPSSAWVGSLNPLILTLFSR